MKHSRRLWLWLTVSLSLLVGLLVVGTGVTLHVHAASLTVTDCSGETGTGRIGSVLASASAGDTITFSCSGTIPISSTLSISKNLTIDGTGQSITLDGGNSVEVLSVSSGVTFTLNALTIARGSASGTGGGLANAGTVTISNSTFANNSAGTGGGGDGGGLFNAGTVTISNSTFANNSTGDGGGLANVGAVTISNSTFANNSTSGNGGGLFNFNAGAVTISNSTFSNNSASLTGGGLANASTVNIGGSIVANNTGGNCRNVGSLTDQGFNLESGTDCGFTGTGSVQNTDPKLGPLANNGGPTETEALLAGSPAIDAGPVASSCPTTDQRGVSRPDNGESSCDIGAYEFVDPVDKDLALTNVPANITVDATSPQGATVTYTTPTATDESGDTSSASVICTPASGSTFAIGNTMVTCTATDSDDTNSPVTASFQVTVNGAATQVNELIATIQGFHLPGKTSKSYISQLQAVQADISANNTAQACTDLTGFITHVQAQSGKQLTVSQANQLITGAKRIQAVLGC